MRFERFLGAALMLAASLVQAQLVPADPDWQEVEAPPAPAFSADGLVSLEIPRSALRFGVAPASISIGADGIVRYVMVASSSTGATNAIYEGIRCGTGEVKVYARHNPGSGWVIAKDSRWRPLQDAPQRHSLVIARTGACNGHSTNRPVDRIVRDLRAPADTRFNQPQ
jgi:hypothetical protein